MTAIDDLARIGVVPVVVIDDAARARDLAVALRDNGIGCAEFTLRTPAGLQALEAAASVDGFLAGAGTVLTREQADAAAAAGAAFAVSPGYDAAVSAHVRALGIAMVPGIATATELQHALADGFDHVKVFPAGSLGGPAYLDALHGPFPDVRFLPSGGVDAANLGEYLSRGHVFAAGGSWMVPRAAIADGAFDVVADAARACAATRDETRVRR